jgi:hypothetical protein
MNSAEGGPAGVIAGSYTCKHSQLAYTYIVYWELVQGMIQFEWSSTDVGMHRKIGSLHPQAGVQLGDTIRCAVEADMERADAERTATPEP